MQNASSFQSGKINTVDRESQDWAGLKYIQLVLESLAICSLSLIETFCGYRCTSLVSDVVLYSGSVGIHKTRHRAHYVKNIHKTGSTRYITYRNMPPDATTICDHMAAHNMHKFGEVRPCGFRDYRRGV